VQEAFVRWHRAGEEEIASPKAYLSAIVTRLSIDQLRSARVQREVYVGPWLPEPLVTEQAPDLTRTAELADSLSVAFLVLLESLSPLERAVFLLRQVFDYDYAEIASIVDKSEASSWCKTPLKLAYSFLDWAHLRSLTISSRRFGNLP
jgi:RNA polymerase sigma-70 factor (ECF subfamily)